jgi:hypothetical protein
MRTIATVITAAVTTVAVCWAIGVYRHRSGWTVTPPGDAADQST